MPVTLRSIYAAAKATALNFTWRRTARTTPHGALRMDGEALAARGQQLFRDSSIGRSLVNAICNKTLPTPIEPKPKLRNEMNEPTPEAEAWNANAQRLWKRWAHDPAMFSLDGMHTFASMQRLVLRTVITEGECFVIKHRRSGNRGVAPSIRIEVVGPQHLDRSRAPSMKSPDQGRPGVEHDADGRPVMYYFRNLDRGMDSVAYPADNVAHVFLPLFPGQQIGESFSATVGQLIHHFQSYYLAEVQGAENASRIFGVLKSTAPGIFGKADVATPPGQEIVDVGWGEILRLLPGEDVSQMEMKRPGNQFAPFVEKTLKLVSAATGIPYEALSGDYSGANFSVAKLTNLVTDAACVPSREMIRDMQASRVWDWFVEAAVLDGMLRMVPSIQAWGHYTGAHYTMPTQPLLEPKVEYEGSALAMSIGLSSWQREVARLGRDPDEVEAEIVEDMARFARMGLPYPGVSPNNQEVLSNE